MAKKQLTPRDKAAKKSKETTAQIGATIQAMESLFKTLKMQLSTLKTDLAERAYQEAKNGPVDEAK